MTTEWRYLPALDGVRALAVVGVVLFHYWPDTFPGGFIGVDVFFVMSGFLITGILLAEFDGAGRIDFRAFWGRRIRRLVPAVIALVVVTSIVTSIIGTGSARQLLDSIGALTWTTNLVEAWIGGSQVLVYNSRTVLDHLWSLAIEEQFYLLWPPLLLLLSRRVRSSRICVAVVVALIAASATSMGLVGGVIAYFRTDTRAFELLVGAALAMTGWATRRVPAVVGGAVGIAGLTGFLIFVARVAPADGWMYPWGFLLVCSAAASMVFAAASGPGWWRWLFETKPVRHLGQVSYGVYLWHVPVLRIMSAGRIGIEGTALQLLRLSVLAAVVEASYQFVEEPFRRGRVPLRLPQVGIGYALAALALIPMAFTAVHDYDHQWEGIGKPPSVLVGQTKVLVVGDLIGWTVADSLGHDDKLAVWSVAQPGCPGDDGVRYLDGKKSLEVGEVCHHWRDQWRLAVKRFHPQVIVLGGGYWDSLEVKDGGPPDRFYRLLERQIDALGSGDIRVLKIESWTKLVSARQGTLDDRRVETTGYNGAVEWVASRHPNVTLIRMLGAPTWDDVRKVRLPLR